MKVLLLAGGDSSEREVSLVSGAALFESLRRLGHNVITIDPATGRSLLDSNGKFLETGSSSSLPQPQVDSEHKMLSIALAEPGFSDVEIVFNGLHGGAGENGSIQNLLSHAGLRCTGSDMTSSAIAMNKAVAKRLFATVGIPTPEWELFKGSSQLSIEEIAENILSRFDLPLIIKPNDSGSTIGLTKVTERIELIPALELAAEESSQLLVEEYIEGRELTVSLLDDHTFPVVEIKPIEGLYDYEAKYTSGKSEYIVPAPIEEKLKSALQDAARKAFDVIGSSGLARVDCLLDNKSNFYILELNTLPGMTRLSLAPMAAASEGVDFDSLVQRIIESAVADKRSTK